MSDTIIAPHPPEDGREWDCQCARCGSSVVTEDCGECGGEGYVMHDCGEDCCPCLYPEPNVPCHVCHGNGCFHDCGSGYEWCSEHPRPGREAVEPGEIEWFVIGGNDD